NNDNEGSNIGNSLLSGNELTDNSNSNNDNSSNVDVEANNNDLLSNNDNNGDNRNNSSEINGNSLLSGNTTETASRNSLDQSSNSSSDADVDVDVAVGIDIDVAIDASTNYHDSVVASQDLDAQVTDVTVVFQDAADQATDAQGDLRTGSIDQSGDAFRGFTGIATIAMDTSVGSVNQAATQVAAGSEIHFD